MKFHFLIPFLFLFSISLFSDSILPKTIIAKVNNSEKLIRFSKKFGAIDVQPIFDPNTPAGKDPILSRYFQIRFPKNFVISSQLLNKFEDQKWIDTVSLNNFSQFHDQPNDERFGDQWNLRAISAEQAWRIETGKPSVVIAVIDSGIDLSHDDLKNQIWQNADEIPDNEIDDDQNGYVDDRFGWDFSDAADLPGIGDFLIRDNDINDEGGHGTHVAGIIAAEIDNGIGIAGIASGCRVMGVRAGFSIAGGGGFLENDDVSAAIAYAVDNGADVINMSWGDFFEAILITDTIDYAWRRGCVLIASVGNSHSEGAMFPAAHRSVIAVGATDRQNEIAFVSNFGSSVDLFAPGHAILSTLPNDRYGTMSGTSMASPHVSAVAGLLISQNPDLKNYEIRKILINEDRRLNALSALKFRSNQLVAEIRSPKNYHGCDNNLAIVITAIGDEIRLEFGSSEVPIDLFPISLLKNSQIGKEINWDTSAIDNGIYTIKLTALENGKIVATDQIVIEVDHTPPKILDLSVGDWWMADRIEPTITIETDDLTIVELHFSNPNVRLISESENHQHVFNLAEIGVPIGITNVNGIITNRSGLTQSFELEPIKTKNGKISTTLFGENRLVNLPKMNVVGLGDFDGDGVRELIGMPIGNEIYNPVTFYEFSPHGETIRLIKKTDEKFLPWAIGDTDGDGEIEILGNRIDQTFLIESDRRIFSESEIWGGQLADLDGDGDDEIISRHTPTQAIRVYDFRNENYELIAVLENRTDGENNLGTRFAIGDFDGDGEIEILAGDSDGDLFIHEHRGRADFQLTWTDRLHHDAHKAYQISAGDLNNDGRSEFIVGGESVDRFDLPVQHRIFQIFSAIGDDDFEPIWTQRVRGVRDGSSGFAIGNIDGDYALEIAIASPPYFYFIDHENLDFRVIWHHSAIGTFRPLIADGGVLFNTENGLRHFRKGKSAIEWEHLNPKKIKILSVNFVSPNRIEIDFDRSLPKIYQSAFHYTVSETINPRSVLLHRSRRRVSLTFPDRIFESGKIYEINIREIGKIEFDVPIEFEIEDLSQLRIYPNPAKDRVIFDRLPIGTEIEIYDISGGLIRSLTHANRRTLLETNQLSSGVYFCVFEFRNWRRIEKLMISHF